MNKICFNGRTKKWTYLEKSICNSLIAHLNSLRQSNCCTIKNYKWPLRLRLRHEWNTQALASFYLLYFCTALDTNTRSFFRLRYKRNTHVFIYIYILRLPITLVIYERVIKKGFKAFIRLGKESSRANVYKSFYFIIPVPCRYILFLFLTITFAVSL